MPPNIDRREETQKRKRKEYENLVEQYYHTRTELVHQDTYRQIHIDIPRMNPDIPLFQQPTVQEVSRTHAHSVVIVARRRALRGYCSYGP